MAVMTIPEAERWLKDSSVKLGKWGWMPVHRKIGKYLRQKTTKDFRGHKNPDGGTWPKAEYWIPKKKLHIGSNAVIGYDNRAGSSNFGKPYKRKIATEDELQRAKRIQWYPEMLLADHKSKFVNPIYRKKGLPELRIKQAYKFYEQFDAAGRRGGTGGVLQMGKFHLRFGLHGWMEKLASLHFGGTVKGKQIRARPLIGLTRTDLKFIDDTYAAHALKMMEKQTSKGE